MRPEALKFENWKNQWLKFEGNISSITFNRVIPSLFQKSAIWDRLIFPIRLDMTWPLNAYISFVEPFDNLSKEKRSWISGGNISWHFLSFNQYEVYFRAFQAVSRNHWLSIAEWIWEIESIDQAVKHW